MLLRRITPLNFGPFSQRRDLEVDPEVTVLTGANDVGKSSLLRLVSFACGETGLVESDVNYDHQFQSGQRWDQHPDVGCEAEFELNEATVGWLDPVHLTSGHRLILKILPRPQGNEVASIEFVSGKRRKKFGGKLNRLPRALFLTEGDGIRDSIDLKSPNEPERKLLEIAFGTQFSADNLLSLNDINRTLHLRRAAEQLQRKAAEILPMGLGFRLDQQQGDEGKLVVQITDSNGGLTPFGTRGSGVRKLLTILGLLLDVDLSTEQVHLLMDEPENSLHADAQRSLRHFLERLAKRPNVQVMYATHSPMMINTLRPKGLRLLGRAVRHEKATTTIDNSPVGENYLPVRASLGLVPSDSLLYSDIAIVVEGLTEILALPRLLLRLEDEEVAGFDDVSTLLSHCHFVNGIGDNFERLCRVAKAQGAKPVIFVDGDKIRQIRQLRLDENHPDVPIVTLPDGTEFEQIVPLEFYLSAIVEVEDSLDADSISQDRFEEWKGDANPREQMLSKQVSRWLADKFTIELNKPLVMDKAVQLVPLDKLVQSECIAELCTNVRRLLN